LSGILDLQSPQPSQEIVRDARFRSAISRSDFLTMFITAGFYSGFSRRRSLFFDVDDPS